MKALKLICKIFLLLLIASSLHAQIPQTISYQGILTTLDGNPVADGNYYITFKLYDAAQSGTALWQEAQNVQISKGIFNVILGKIIPLSVAFNKPYWLEILFQGTALAPRIELTASAYSLNSQTVVDSAITSQKIAAGQVVRSINALTDKVTLKAGQNVAIATKKDTVTISATGAVADNDWTVSGNNMYSAVSGNVGIGTTQPAGKLHLQDNVSQHVPIILENNDITAGIELESQSATRPGEGILHFGIQTNRGIPIKAGQNSNAGVFRVDTRTSGTGPKFEWWWRDNNTASERSLMTLTREGNLGIGTAALPSQKLEVAGTVQMTGFKMPTGAANNYVLTSDASGIGTWKSITVPSSGWTISGNNIYSAVSGNVGIGTTNPSHKFHVVAQDAVGLFESTGDLAFLRLTTKEGINNRVEFKNNPGGRLSLWTAGTGAGDVLNITRDGNIGIGTTTPAQKLEVAGTVQMTGFKMPTGAANNYVLTSDASGIGTWKSITVPSSGWTISGNNIYSAVSGNVGIGITNPGAKFHTVGDYIRFEGTTPSAANCPEIQLRETNSNSYWAMIKRGSTWSPEQNQLLFAFYNGSTWFPAMNLKTNKDVIFNGNIGIGGKVGIGMLNPQCPLQIVAGENTPGLQISQNKTVSNSCYGLVISSFHSNLDKAELKGIYVDVVGDNGVGPTFGVYGIARGTSTGTKCGIYGYASGSGNKYAGYFSGNVLITEILIKGAGSFKIDHPLEPANKYLYHSFVESPDMKNIYDGTVVLDQTGEATVILPDWFEALNKDFRYQLTCIGGYAPVYIAEEIAHNQFKIAGGKPGLKVSWQVTGIRHDAFAEKHRIPVEELKSDRERGKYLHPEAFGLSETLGVDYENIKQAKENYLRKEE